MGAAVGPQAKHTVGAYSPCGSDRAAGEANALRHAAGLIALLLALFLALGLLDGSFALTALSVDRPATASVTDDTLASAATYLNNFGDAAVNQPLNGAFVQVGAITNEMGSANQLTLTVDPNITKACKNLTCSQNTSWDLYFCLATDTSSIGGTTCRNNAGGASDQLRFNGSGPVNPGAQTTATIFSVSPGSTLYLMVRVKTTPPGSENVCADAVFTVNFSAAGIPSAALSHSAGTPRRHIYRFGSGCP